jgi:hypothetical protein
VSYLPAVPSPHTVADTLSAASLFGVPVSRDALEGLASAVQAQLAAVDQLEELDVHAGLPVTGFDPRWHG